MNVNRRNLLRGMVAASALPLFNIGCAGFGRLAGLRGGSRVRIAVIGCGDWGGTLLRRAGAVGGCELVAVAEPDPNAFANSKFWQKAEKSWKKEDLARAKVYADYRELFAEVGETLDAVFVATPNHHHALPTLLAIRAGANVFVEKPMAHTMEEVIRIEREARAAGVVVRVGNKGHNMTHRPYLAKCLREGVIGDLEEVFSFSDRPNTMFRRPHAVPPPKGMDWDLWCGGSPVCEPYGEEDGRVGLHPHDWHSWIDYGNGSIGNMGTHVLDTPFQCLDLALPTAVTVRDVKWGCPGAWNARGTLDFAIPAGRLHGAFALHWNDGVADGVDISSKYMTGWYNRVYRREHTNFPAELLELERKWNVKTPLPAFGTVFVGTKGMVYEEFHRTLRFFPEGGRFADLPIPDADTLESEERRIIAEFLGAVRGAPGEIRTDLDFSVPLAKTLMLANMVVFAGKGTYAFDGAKTGHAAADAHARHAYRKGWEVA